MKVFINPGHALGGYPDSGAIGPTGLREADVVADIGLMVAEYLTAAGCEIILISRIAYMKSVIGQILGAQMQW
ncbi:N-acetylmuramoyl-L-alanine amidase [Anaerospora hongkongensis]|uniref:N-acetylmuramoyl-L-alanine amidase n=1 Tax=Anaerospora hongkongensis TaxID=244830 RepID=UPI00289DD074|nr:N-acetylmuramoyl-L-alanine amidase [Anaerospora hongkongensis]